MNLTSQSNIVIGAIALGFIVFVTVRGELPQYLAIIGISQNSNTGK